MLIKFWTLRSRKSWNIACSEILIFWQRKSRSFLRLRATKTLKPRFALSASRLFLVYKSYWPWSLKDRILHSSSTKWWKERNEIEYALRWRNSRLSNCPWLNSQFTLRKISHSSYSGGYELNIDCWIEPDEEIDPDEPPRYRKIFNSRKHPSGRFDLPWNGKSFRLCFSNHFRKSKEHRVIQLECQIANYPSFFLDKLVFGCISCGAKMPLLENSHAF